MQAEMMPSLCPDAFPQPPPPPLQTTNDYSHQFEELNDFSFDCAETTSSQVPADQIFQNGVIKPIYHHHQQQQQRAKTELKELDPNATTSAKNYSSDHSSSSESNLSSLSELDSDTYCVWEPKTNEKESNSWSRRWKIKDLLARNLSGKEGTNPTKINNDDNEKKKTMQQQQQARKKEGRRSSYLPYRQELVGIFGSSR